MVSATTKVVSLVRSIHPRGPTVTDPVLMLYLIRPSFPGFWGENSFMGVFFGFFLIWTMTDLALFGRLLQLITTTGFVPVVVVVPPFLVEHFAMNFLAL